MRWLLLALLPSLAAAQDAGVAPIAPARADAGPRAPTDLNKLAEMAGKRMLAAARARNRAALAARQRKDFPKALRLFREAHDLNPTDPEIANNLAFLYQQLGNRVDAEKMYRVTLRLDPERGVAYENLAGLLATPGAAAGRLEEAGKLLVKARELRGNHQRIVLAQARVAARQARFEVAQRFYNELDAPTDAAALEIGDFYRDLGQPELAQRWYGKIDEGSEHFETAVRRIRDLEVEREARRYGWTRPLDEIPEKARTLAQRGRASARKGDGLRARRLFEEALALAPHFGAVHADLGDLLRAGDDALAAELAYLRALSVASGDADILRRLADFYLDAGRAAEGAYFLTRVLQVRPDWTEQELRLAKAWQAAGDPRRALLHVERYLTSVPEDAPAAEARKLKQALVASLPKPAESPDATPDDRPMIAAINRARALAVKGRPDAAMAELRALPEADRGVMVRNLEGRILSGAGRVDDAAEAFAGSLALDRAQPEIQEQLASIRLQQGRLTEGRALLAEAEASGSLAARFLLVRLDLAPVESAWPDWLVDLGEIGALREAHAQLRPLVAGERLPRYGEEAARLLGSLDARIRAAYTAAAVGVLVLVLPLGLGAWRLWGGIDLADLVARHPETGPEVQRTLAAIRHEVLKHNTMLLTGLVDGIDAGRDIGTDAQWCRNSLLGAPDGTGREDSAEQRLHAYADRLIQLGRAHDERLNLRRKDPALSALLRGFKVVRRHARLLDRADQLGARGLRTLADGLEDATQLLNVEGYEAVRGLLDTLRVLEVDDDLLRTVYERTRREPAFADAKLAPVAIESANLPVRIAIPRHDFEDVLANLVRNALQSCRRHDDAANRVGIAVEREVDMITGLERVLFLIQDASPQRLTSEMLRGRYIEAGLGLTADIVSRYEGTLDVVAQPDPWAKAVVVKLPIVDELEAA